MHIWYPTYLPLQTLQKYHKRYQAEGHMHEVIRKVTITAGRQTIARPFPAVIDDRHNVIQQQERVGLRYAIYMHYLHMCNNSRLELMNLCLQRNIYQSNDRRTGDQVRMHLIGQHNSSRHTYLGSIPTQ